MKTLCLFLLLLFSIFSSAKSTYQRNSLFLQRKPTVNFQRYRHLQADTIQTNDNLNQPPTHVHATHNNLVDPNDPTSAQNLQGILYPDSNQTSNFYPSKINYNNIKDPFSSIPYEPDAKKVAKNIRGDYKEELYKKHEMPSTVDELTDQVQGMSEKFKDFPGMPYLTRQNGPLAGLIPAIDSTSPEEALANLESDYVTAEADPSLPPNVDELLTINLDDTGTLDQSYISIASDVKTYEATYIDCMSHLSDLDFLQTNIDTCVGKGYRFVNDDIEYFKRKILAKADSIIQTRMIEECFKVAGTDLVMSTGCDLLQKDVLKLLWSELNYYILIDYHRNKYIFQNSNLPTDMLDQLTREFKVLYLNQDELLTELYNHKMLAIQRIADYIADRKNEMQEDLEEYGPLNVSVVTSKNVIQVDSVRQKLQSLNDVRRSQPGIMYKKTERKTKEVNGLQHEFVSPWGKDKSAKFGRSAQARKLMGNGEGNRLVST